MDKDHPLVPMVRGGGQPSRCCSETRKAQIGGIISVLSVITNFIVVSVVLSGTRNEISFLSGQVDAFLKAVPSINALQNDLKAAQDLVVTIHNQTGEMQKEIEVAMIRAQNVSTTVEVANETAISILGSFKAANDSYFGVVNSLKIQISGFMIPSELSSGYSALPWVVAAAQCTGPLGSFIGQAPKAITCNSFCQDSATISAVGCGGDTADCAQATILYGMNGVRSTLPRLAFCDYTAGPADHGIICCCNIKNPNGCSSYSAVPDQ